MRDQSPLARYAHSFGLTHFQASGHDKLYLVLLGMGVEKVRKRQETDEHHIHKFTQHVKDRQVNL